MKVLMILALLAMAGTSAAFTQPAPIHGQSDKNP